MGESKYRLLIIAPQPVHYAAYLRSLSQHPKLEILTAYCSLPDAKLWNSPEYLTKHVFDIPALEGYPWVYVPNRSPLPSLTKFYGLINPGLGKLIADCDCCLVYGHAYASLWLALAIAKLSNKPLLLGTDATYLEVPDNKNWKVPLKKRLIPFFYNRVPDIITVSSTAGKSFIHSLGIPEERIAITPYIVDNDAIAATANKTNRQQIRQDWSIPVDATVVVFCAKFLPRKRPQDLLKAFANANVPNSYLVFVGEGPLGDMLGSETQKLGVEDRVRFLGMVNYSRLPEVYAASDVLVHPADHEPWGLPVNEAMVCGIPAVVSNRVGSGYDLVEEGKTGFVYPSGNVEALSAILSAVLPQRDMLRQMGQAARKRMETWSERENAEGYVHAVEKAIALKQHRQKD